MKRVGTVWKLLAAMAVLSVAVLQSYASIPSAYQEANECEFGRRTAAVRPSGATDAFGYDDLGNWTTYTNAEGRVYTMAYDALGRLVAATNAANEQVFANRYDPVGNLTNRTDGAGNTIAYSYDVLNRLVLQESGVGSPASSFVYDPVGSAPSEARRFLQGESPCRVRTSHPLVPSVGTVEEESHPNDIV